MHTSGLFRRVALGAGAGLAGTVLMQGVRTASQKWLSGARPPIRQDPGEFMVEQAERALPEEARPSVPEAAETAAAKSLALGYGMTFGALYATVRPGDGNLLIDASALGLGTWAVGYLGWLPATGLMPPVSRQGPEKVSLSALQHVAFGLFTVGAYQQLRRLVAD